MSFRQIRTTALDPLAVQQLQEENQSALKQPLINPSSTLDSTPTPTPATPSSSPLSSPPPPPSANNVHVNSNQDLGLPSNFNLMTERQQMAYLMRATSEGEAQKKTSLLAANKKKAKFEEDDEESSEEDENDDSEDNNEDGSDEDQNSSDSSSSSDESDESGEEDASPEEGNQRGGNRTHAASNAAGGKHRISAPAKTSQNSSEPVVMEHDHLPRLIRRPLEYAIWSADKQKKWDNIGKNPNAFYLQYLAPGILPRGGANASSTTAADWSDKEQAIFLWSLEAYPPEGQWGLFSMNIPGRTGLECEAFFKRLQKEGKVSSTPGKKNQPPTIKIEKSAGNKHNFESTPIIVARATPSTPSKKEDAVAAEKRDQELRTAIAQLSLASMPGTQGLKLQVFFRTEAHLKGSKEKEKEKDRKEREKEAPPSTPQPSARKGSRTAGAGVDALSLPASAATSSAKKQQQSQQQQMPATPSTPFTNNSSAKRNARQWGSGSNDGGSGSSSSSSSAEKRAKATAELMDDMMDISPDGNNSNNNDESVPRVPSRKRQTSVDAPELGRLYANANTGGPAAQSDTLFADMLSSIPTTKLYAEHAIDTKVVASREDVPASEMAASETSSTPVAASASILPFANFTIPAHTPFVTAKRQKLVATGPMSDAGRVIRHAVPAVQAQPFYRERVDVNVDIELDAKGDVVMRERETGKVVRKPQSASCSSSAAASSSSAMEDDVAEETFQSFETEVSKLEASFRVKLRRLSTHQSQQIARVRAAYAVPTTLELEGEDGPYLGNTRADSVVNANNHTHGAFGTSIHSFTSGCRKMLHEYFNNLKEVEQETIQSILNRCRTYGEAILEIRLNYKTLLKELQREHQTGRDVLQSLRTAGLLV